MVELKQRARQIIQQLAALDESKKLGTGVHGQVIGMEPYVIRATGNGLQCLLDAQYLLHELLDPFEHRATLPSPSTAPTEQNQSSDLNVMPPFAAPAGQITQLLLVMAALHDARLVAMRNVVEARVPECGDFGRIAQQLDFAITTIEQAKAAVAEQSEASRCRAQGGNTSAKSVESSTAPTVEVGERAAFEAWWHERSLKSWQSSLLASEYGQPMPEGWGDGYKRHAREAWQARAALASQPAALLAYIAPHVMESLRLGCHVATTLTPEPDGKNTEAVYGR